MHKFSPEAIMNSPEKAELVAAIEEKKSHWERYNDNAIARARREHAARLEKLGFAKLFGAKVSVDHGETWRIFALCPACIKSVEPPLRVKNEGEAGALNCDWCGTYNESFEGKL